MEPCGDTVKDAIEEINESTFRAWQTYSKFVGEAQADALKIVRGINNGMDDYEIPATEKYYHRAMADEVSRAINEQSHQLHIAGNAAGNAMRPIMRLLIHMTAARSCRKLSTAGRKVAALPAGRGRAALPR